MKLYEYTPYVLKVLAEDGPDNQTNLSEKVWGSSGRGNTTLTKILFPEIARKGYALAEKRGRSIVYSITEKGREFLRLNPWEYEYTEEELTSGRKFKPVPPKA